MMLSIPEKTPSNDLQRIFVREQIKTFFDSCKVLVSGRACRDVCLPQCQRKQFPQVLLVCYVALSERFLSSSWKCTTETKGPNDKYAAEKLGCLRQHSDFVPCCDSFSELSKTARNLWPKQKQKYRVCFRTMTSTFLPRTSQAHTRTCTHTLRKHKAQACAGTPATRKRIHT